MNRPADSPVSPAQVAEIERRIQWPVVAVAVFLAMLAGLLAMAALTLFSPAPPVAGLPDDVEVAAARELVRGVTPVAGAELRFQSALVAADPDPRPITAAAAWRVRAASALIARARTRLPRDPRLAVCAAHLDLALRLYPAAERGYRGVLYFGDHVPDAHLGLGVTLALEAKIERDVLRARALELQAIAQFAAVREGDGPWLAALYDRALLLEQVGRGEEARRWARVYLESDPGSAWAERLRGELALPEAPG